MASRVIMPQGGQDLTTGRVVCWLKKEGDTVKKGEIICEVETEKAVFEVPAPQDGVLLQIVAHDTEEVEILSTIGYVGEAGEEINDLIKTKSITESLKSKTNVQKINSQPVFEQGKQRILISPKARKLARDNNLPLATLISSRTDGKIKSADVMEALENSEQPIDRNNLMASRTIKPGKVRKAASRRLVQSWANTPHIFITVAVNMTRAVKFRENNTHMEISFNDLIIRACALALKEFPEVNASFIDEDTIRLWDDINIGLAVDTPQGLMVPVIEGADKLTLSDIASRLKEIIEKARSGKQDLSKASHFTISNLGMYQVEAFTAVINPPEAAILAVSSIRQQPQVGEGDKIVVLKMMNLTLSMDHRVGDGVLAAKFANAIKQALENPETLL